MNNQSNNPTNHKTKRMSRAVVVLVSVIIYVLFAAFIGLVPVSERHVSPYCSIFNCAEPIPSNPGWMSNRGVPTEGGIGFQVILFPPTLEVGSRTRIEFSSFNFRDYDASSNINRVCIDNIYAGESNFVVKVSGDFPACFNSSFSPTINGRGILTSSSDLSASNVFWESTFGENHFWFPYDNVDLNLSLVAEISFYNNTELVLEERHSPLLSIYASDIVGYEIYYMGESTLFAPFFREEPTSSGVEFVPTTDKVIFTALRFVRPVFERIIIPSLFMVMLAFIILLAFVESVESFIQGGLAVFFGLFSLRQIVLPATTEVRTIVDVAVWGLYFAFAGALILQFRLPNFSMVAKTLSHKVFVKRIQYGLRRLLHRRMLRRCSEKDENLLASLLDKDI